MRSGKHLYPRNEPVSQLTALRPLSIIPFGIKALYPNRCYLNNDNNADHLLFSTIRKHSFLSFGKVDIYLFLCIVRPCVCQKGTLCFASRPTTLQLAWNPFSEIQKAYFNLFFYIAYSEWTLASPQRTRVREKTPPNFALSFPNPQSDRKGTVDLCKVSRYVSGGMICIRGGWKNCVLRPGLALNVTVFCEVMPCILV